MSDFKAGLATKSELELIKLIVALRMSIGSYNRLIKTEPTDCDAAVFEDKLKCMEHIDIAQKELAKRQIKTNNSNETKEPYMSQDNTGAAKMHKVITVKEFLTYKPTHEQCVQGKIKVINGDVVKLQPYVREALRNGQMPISSVSLNNHIHIIAGHTRQEAARRQVEIGELDLGFTFEVTVEKPNPTKAELSALVARANGKLSRSKSLIHAVYGHTPISVKVIAPVFEALRESGLNESMSMNMAGRLGGLLNRNPEFLKCLAENKPVEIGGPDLYRAKSMEETGAQFLNAAVLCDLRPFKKMIAKRIGVAASLIETLIESGLWKEKLGNSKNLIYTLMGLALRKSLIEGTNNIDGAVATGKVKRVLNAEGRKIKKAITQYNDNTDKQEDTILGLFGAK